MAKTTGSRNAGATMRLLVLGLLKRYGPNHGHAMRQFIRNAFIDEWADVQPGSLYYALDQLAKEELIVADRTEQVGQRPPRTIYRITDAGEGEIEKILVSLIESVRPTTDPFNLALLFSSTLPDSKLADLIRMRITLLKEQLLANCAGRDHALSRGLIAPHGAEIFTHFEMLLQVDIDWHEQFLDKLLKGEVWTLPAAQMTATHPLFNEKGGSILPVEER